MTITNRDELNHWFRINTNHSDLYKFSFSKSGEIDVDGDLNLQNKEFHKIPVKFGIVTGDCWYTGSHFIDLENSPNVVTKSLGAYDCPKLESLVGCPATVGNNLYIMRNFELKSLRGISKFIGNGVNMTGLPKVLPSEMRYILLSTVMGSIAVGSGAEFAALNAELREILEKGRIDGDMPSELIPEKIRRLKEMDAAWKT